MKHLLCIFVISALFDFLVGETKLFEIIKFEYKTLSPNVFDANFIVIHPGNATQGVPPSISLDTQTFEVGETFNVVFKILLSTPKCEMCHKVLDLNLDACRFLRTKGSDNYIRRAVRVFKKYGKIPARCPVEVGNYWLHNMTIDNKLFPSYLPEGPIEFRFDLNATVKGEEKKYAYLNVKGLLTKKE